MRAARFLTAVLALLASTQGLASQQFNGTARAFAHRYATDTATTASTTFTAIPQMVLGINNQALNGPILIQFCGTTAPGSPPDTDGIFVQAQVDGVLAEPIFAVLDAESPNEYTEFRPHCVTFVAQNVPSGRHVIQILWKTVTGNPVTMQGRTVTAFYD